MTQQNDAVVTALSQEGYGNDFNTATVTWLNTNAGVNSQDYETAWNQYWDSLLIPAGAFNDRYSLWLSSLGFTQGSFDDQRLAYWSDRAGLSSITVTTCKQDCLSNCNPVCDNFTGFARNLCLTICDRLCDRICANGGTNP